ncbi:MAG: undecaprenyl-diphosphate phosphatase, partial [Clostridia bacterium]|nr:undecaprenyl-diphosphate phosphatase [Clostridia bacterium]
SVKYAFLSAIPVLITKIILQTVTVLQDGIQMNWLPYLMGMVAAFLSSVFSIAVMRKAMRKGYCKRFGIYCLIVGLMILIIQMRG